METWKIVALVVIVALVAIFGARARGASGEQAAQAREKIANGALLLDVRTPQEYAGGHIDGAVNIPVQQLQTRLGELGEKDRQIVVYCRSGARSGQATRIMQNAGFHAVQDVGPMSALQ
jgi:phage shock protein E